MSTLSIKKVNELTKKKKKGFTLVELVIVIAIIAILAAMAIPKLGSMRNSARVSNDVAAAKNIATIASTLISDGTITAPTSGTTSIDVSDSTDASIGGKIRGKLDGKIASTGKTEASNTAFFVNVASDGGVKVRVGSATGTELYPDSDGGGRTLYASTIN